MHSSESQIVRPVNKPAPWEGDVLHRKSYAEFLTSYLTGRTKKSGAATSSHVPFCMALDARWGTGKTFFVTNWSRQLLDETKHPTFVFDAWASDYLSDPVIVFMAAFKKAIDDEIAKLPAASETQVRAQRAVAGGLTKIRKVMLPMGKAILKGAVNKASGGALKEILNTWEGEERTLDEVTEEMGEAAVSGAREGLDKYFENALKEQTGRGQLLQDFRDSIASALTLLRDQRAIDLPFFVFVDEIDRCRPNFAVELLEGLKHIFNIPGLCVVVSTNIEQLAHAMSAVYGLEFDGRGYLQRFFDAEYRLPMPTRLEYSRLLVADFPSISAATIYSGLPGNGFKTPLRANESVTALEWIADAFDLDLRSQRRVTEIVDASVAALGKAKGIHLLWLGILAATQIRSAELFELLCKKGLQKDRFDNLWVKTVPNDFARSHFVPRDPNVTGHDYGLRETTLRVAAWAYYSQCWSNVVELTKHVGEDSFSALTYPNSILCDLEQGAPGTYRSGSHIPTAIVDYCDLVRYAGHLQA